MTNTSFPVTNAAVPRTGWVVAVLWTGVVFVNASVGALSVSADLTQRGVPFRPAEPWIWEWTSGIGLLVWLWPVLQADGWLRQRPPWLRWTGVVLGSVVFSALHVATMVGLRHLAYRVAGWRYDFGPWLDGFLYEYRKDVLTYVVILVVAAAWRRLVVPPASPPAVSPPSPPPGVAPTFVVPTSEGDVLLRADEIDWVEAQGNYVGLHAGGRTRLLRQTLADTERQLAAHGFIRTHRRALVNRARMQALVPASHGEPGVRLSSGEVVPLSEARRADVLKRLNP